MSALAEAETGYWTDQRAALRELLAKGDRDRFLHWHPVVDAMFFEPPAEELDYLKTLPDWPSIRTLLKDPGVGGGAVDPVLGTNGNIVHHAYSMFRFEQATGHSVLHDDRILEVGGGYGNFCRLVLERGFAGRYVIYDLPETLQLQQWYLGRTLREDQLSRVEFVTSLPEGADTIIGLWSISEVPLELRDRIKALKPDHFLIGYQHNFSGIANADYFARWADDKVYAW